MDSNTPEKKEEIDLNDSEMLKRHKEVWIEEQARRDAEKAKKAKDQNKDKNK